MHTHLQAQQRTVVCCHATSMCCILADIDCYLALEVVRGPVVLASQLEALIDEDFIQLAVPQQASKVLRLLIAPLTSHKSQLVKLKSITPANSTAFV